MGGAGLLDVHGQLTQPLCGNLIASDAVHGIPQNIVLL